MKAIDFSNDLLRRLYIVTIVSIIFIAFLLASIFFMGANNEQNKLKIINEHYSALVLNEFDTIIHDIKVGMSTKNLSDKLNMILQYHDVVDAIYVLEEDDDVVSNDAVLSKKTQISQIYTHNPTLEINELSFFGLHNGADFVIDRFVFQSNDDVYSLIAHKIEDDANANNQYIIVLLNLQKMANKFTSMEYNSFLIDKEGYMFISGQTTHENIYDKINLQTDWKQINSGFVFGGNVDKARYYSINYIPMIGLGVYSQKYFLDILYEYGSLTVLTLVVFLLFLTILFDTLVFTRNDFIIPFEKFKHFLTKLWDKNEFSTYDFRNHKEMIDIYKISVDMFFENKDLVSKLDTYQNEHDLLFENGNLIILYVDAKDGRILSCSKKACEFYGYSKVQMLTKTFFDFEISSLYDFYLSNFNALRNGMPVGNIHITSTGEKKVVNLSINQVVRDFDSFHIVIVNDMTRLISIGSMIRDIDNIVQYGTTLVLGIDKELYIKQASDNIESILKYKKDYILDGQIHISDIIAEQNIFEDIKQHISSRTSSLYDQNIAITLPNSSVHWFRASIKVSQNNDIIAYIFLTDVTFLVQRNRILETDIKLKEEHLEGIITWLYDVEANAYEFHNSFFTLFSDGEYNSKIMQRNMLYKFIDPNFVESLEKEIQKSVEDKKYFFDIKVKATKKVAYQYGDTVDLWLNFKGHQATLDIQRNGKSKLVIIGILEDISIKVATEDRVNLLAKIFETSQEGIFITNKYQEIKEANQSFTRITGYSLADVKGKRATILKSYIPHQNKQFYDDMWNRIRQFSNWQGEIYNKRKNGEIYPELLSITAIKDEYNREVTDYIGMFTDITSIKAKENELIQMAYYDKLTGLPNKEKFTQTLDIFIKHSLTHQSKFAVLFMDLDGFKAANDTYGHECGDTVLEQVASRLEDIFKSEKVSHNSMVARLGGDEFTAILANISNEQDARDIARIIINKIGEIFIIKEYRVNIGVTIGITYYPQNNQDHTNFTSKELLEQADWAMYQAKLAGKNRYYELNNASGDIFIEYKNLLAKFENFDTNNFSIMYQPIYDALANQIISYEVQLSIKEIKALSVSDILKTLSQKYWFSDLNIWIIKSAIETQQELNLHNKNLLINIPISQLNSTVFFKKFKELANEVKFSNVKFVLSDIFTTRNPADDVNELEKRYKDFGVSFIIDDIDEKADELIQNLDINIKDLRVNHNYTKNLVQDYHNIQKLDFIITVCKDENKNIGVKAVQNAFIYKILTSLGYYDLCGDFIQHAVKKEELLDANQKFLVKTKYLKHLALQKEANRNNLLNFYKFIIFQMISLNNIARLLQDENVKYFDIKSYERDFMALQKLQDVSFTWVCDDARSLINEILKADKNNTLYQNKNRFIADVANENLKLQNNVIGE